MRLFSTIVIIMIFSNAFCQTDLKKKESKNASFFFNKDSLLKEFDYFRADSIICHSMVETVTEREIFLYVDKMPKYGEDDHDLPLYIHKNLKYPIIPGFDLEGIVYVALIVEANGTLSNFRIAKGVHEFLDNEALRIIQNMPNWQPGECYGQKVPVFYIIPVSFRIRYMN